VVVVAVVTVVVAVVTVVAVVAVETVIVVKLVPVVIGIPVVYNSKTFFFLVEGKKDTFGCVKFDSDNSFPMSQDTEML
jgi:hypothetical protein